MNLRIKRDKIKVNTVLLKLYLLVFAISVISVLFYDNATITAIVVALEVASLVYCFFRKKFVDYFGLYILYCGLSLEFIELAEGVSFYSFKETRIFGLNLGIVALIPLVMYAFVKRIGGTKERECTLMHRFIFFYVATWGIAVVMGIIMALGNDNNVNAFFNMPKLIIEEAYEKGLQPIFMFLIFMWLLVRCADIQKLEYYFEAVLVGCIFFMAISFFTGGGAYYGGMEILIAPNNARWLPILLLFPLYKKYKHTTRFWILGLIGAYFSLRYNATGKTVIVYVAIPFALSIYYIKNRDWKKLWGWIAMIPLVLVGGMVAIQKLGEVSGMFKSKLLQAQSLIKGIFGGGMVGMRSSPLKRFEEIWNIVLEYVDKPYLILFGKGMGGTFVDRVGMLRSGGAFLEEEWNAGLFYNMHETLNKLLLMSGLLGMIFLVWVVVKGIKHFSSTPWLIVGVYWFLISYGYSVTMTAVGLSCLLYGLYQIKVEDKRQTLYKSEIKRVSVNESRGKSK